jgi:hypothetical protein
VVLVRIQAEAPTKGEIQWTLFHIFEGGISATKSLIKLIESGTPIEEVIRLAKDGIEGMQKFIDLEKN